MSGWDGLIALVVILGILYIVYTRVKNQDLKDTWEELKELFVRDKT